MVVSTPDDAGIGIPRGGGTGTSHAQQYASNPPDAVSHQQQQQSACNPDYNPVDAHNPLLETFDPDGAIMLHGRSHTTGGGGGGGGGSSL
mmetsp:Transcript_17439/g.43035  ORF Transcript_17439/g.43035 Transcript_17439/m.43035 type:complete len:90 (-) Transcript_17439:265-534(-)